MRDLSAQEMELISGGIDATERLLLFGGIGAVGGGIWGVNQLVVWGDMINPAATVILDLVGYLGGSTLGLIGGLIIGSLFNEMMV